MRWREEGGRGGRAPHCPRGGRAEGGGGRGKDGPSPHCPREGRAE